MVLLNDLVAHPGAVIHAVDMPFRHNLHQIQVARVVLGQQNQVVIALVVDAVVPFGNVHLTANDGLYIRVLFGVFEELFYAVHVAMVRNGKRRHPQLIGPVEKVFDG